MDCHLQFQLEWIDESTNDFYVADGYSNAKVHKYDENGKYLFSWENLEQERQFNIVHNISTDSEGLVYVADKKIIEFKSLIKKKIHQPMDKFIKSCMYLCG